MMKNYNESHYAMKNVADPIVGEVEVFQNIMNGEILPYGYFFEIVYTDDVLTLELRKRGIFNFSKLVDYVVVMNDHRRGEFLVAARAMLLADNFKF